EQRLLCAEVISDLAREGIGRAGDRADGGAVESACLEQRACRVEEARTHALTGSASCARTVAGRGGMGRAQARALPAALAPHAVSVISDFGQARASCDPDQCCLYNIQILEDSTSRPRRRAARAFNRFVRPVRLIIRSWGLREGRPVARAGAGPTAGSGATYARQVVCAVYLGGEGCVTRPGG